MIEAVIFDMDGLLLDSEGYWQECERMIFKDLGIILNPKMQRNTVGLRTDELIEFWHKHFGWKGPSPKEVEDLYEAQMLNFYKNNAELMPGAVHALDFFKEKKLPLALASSSKMFLIDAFLNKFNLENYFKIVKSAENEEYGKPHPAVYLNTAKQLNTKPYLCLALEDSFHGVMAAKAARMQTIAVPASIENKFYASDIVLNSLNELTEDVFQTINTI